MLNDDDTTTTTKLGNGYKNGSVKMNGHAHGSEILANGNLRNGGKGDHVEKKRL